MSSDSYGSDKGNRAAPLEIHGDEFRKLGHRLVDDIAEFLDGLPRRPVTTGESPKEIRRLLGSESLPQTGSRPDELLAQTAKLLFDHSLFNGHPKFWGYITSSGAPIGLFADLLAASVNPNVGAAILSPVASEIEAQTIRWIADLIGYPRNCGGLLVSGGNMANFVCFLTARRMKAPWDIDAGGLSASKQRLVVYVSKETHAWIEKAAELFGMGTQSIRWIATNHDQQMDVKALEQQIIADRAANHFPMMVVGAAGTVSTGAIDHLPQIASICK
jgi:glutamate/tyrosine decarboxylase-like PLP-dependent enzyme